MHLQWSERLPLFETSRQLLSRSAIADTCLFGLPRCWPRVCYWWLMECKAEKSGLADTHSEHPNSALSWLPSLRTFIAEKDEEISNKLQWTAQHYFVHLAPSCLLRDTFLSSLTCPSTRIPCKQTNDNVGFPPTLDPQGCHSHRYTMLRATCLRSAARCSLGCVCRNSDLGCSLEFSTFAYHSMANGETMLLFLQLLWSWLISSRQREAVFHGNIESTLFIQWKWSE